MSSKQANVKAKVPLGFQAKLYEKPGLTAEEVQEVKDAFDLFDTDSSGAVSVEELIEAMKSLGLDQKNEAVFNMIKDIDTDGSGQLEFVEFLEMMTAKLSDKTPPEELKKVFNIFDSDRTGEISLQNLKRMAHELGEEISNDELAEMIDRNDLDGDGKWSFEDFCEVMTNKTASKYKKAKAVAAVVKHKCPWTGRYKQSNKWVEMDIEHMKMDKEGAITGTGSDEVGKFNIAGNFKIDGVVRFDKKYVGAHTVIYEGKIDKDGAIKGKWRLDGKSDSGDFELKTGHSTASGYCMEGKKKNNMSLVFVYHDDVIYGHGVDAQGAFSVSGTYHSASNEILFDKNYYGKSKVSFRGTRKNETIEGEYSLQGKTWEAFHLEHKK